MVHQKVGLSIPGRETSKCKVPVSGELKEYLEDRVVSKGDGHEVREVAGGPDWMGSHQTLLITEAREEKGACPHTTVLTTLPANLDLVAICVDKVAESGCDRDSFRLRVTMIRVAGQSVTGLVVPSRDLGFVV